MLLSIISIIIVLLSFRGAIRVVMKFHNYLSEASFIQVINKNLSIMAILLFRYCLEKAKCSHNNRIQ